jgi:hypothetical protein
MAQNVLITGGTGLIGSRLTQLLLQKGYTVSYLSRRKESITNVDVYLWDVDKQYIGGEAIEKADYIVHLAGAGIADKRWTDQRKKEILDSRTQTTQLLYDYIRKSPSNLKAFIGASAIGIYGADRGEEWLTEESRPGDDFLAEVTEAWEGSVRPIADLGVRTVMLRIGIVLSMAGGALAKIVQPVKMGVGAPLGSGKQFVSWIHIDDMCQMIIYAMENNELHGVFNAAAPHPATNAELTRTSAQVLGKSMLPVNVPEFGLRLVFGELAVAVLRGSRVSSQKVVDAGYRFQFPELKGALQDLLK